MTPDEMQRWFGSPNAWYALVPHLAWCVAFAWYRGKGRFFVLRDFVHDAFVCCVLTFSILQVLMYSEVLFSFGYPILVFALCVPVYFLSKNPPAPPLSKTELMPVRSLHDELAEKRAEDTKRVFDKVGLPPALRGYLASKWGDTRYTFNPNMHADDFKLLVDCLPHKDLIGKPIKTPGGKQWGNYTWERYEETEDYRIPQAYERLQPYFADAIKETPITFTLPEKIRTQHHHIVAGSGHGKTQCLQQMILNDLETDASIVVIDSQGDMINRLATRIPEDRLVLVDPEHCPPALNIFAQGGGDERQIASTVELYEYIFSALDAELTSKQSVVYRYLTRLMLTVPGASIQTMREILAPGGIDKFADAIAALPPTARSFFEGQFRSRDYNETRGQILRRLYTVLENETFERMLSAPDIKLDLADALDSGKVVLINTAKSYLKNTAASLFGRIFIAGVMQVVMERGERRRRTYLYIDEFQDYAEDSPVLYNLFEQARKYELGVIVAHQGLYQLPQQLRQSLSANTAIKFAGGVSADDRSALASQMHTTPDFIMSQGQGHFAAYFRNIGTVPYTVEIGRLDRTPAVTDISVIRARMRRLYGVAQPIRPLNQPKPPSNPDEVPESGKW